MLGRGRSTRLDALGSGSLPSCSGDGHHVGPSVTPAPSLGTRPRVRQPVLSARVATPSPLCKIRAQLPGVSPNHKVLTSQEPQSVNPKG